MKTATICYLPSPTDPRFHTAAFLRNLQANPPAGDLILFSDADHPDLPGVLKLKGPVELASLKSAKIQKPGTSEMVENRAAVNNLIFLTALRIVEKQGYSHFLYLEEDCRVRNQTEIAPAGEGHFDQIIFGEFFAQQKHLIAAGSVVVYNPYNHTLKTAHRFERYLHETAEAGRRNVIPVYGWLGAASGQGSTVFVNGAGGVYEVAGLNMLFPERHTMSDPELAAKIWAWDFEIGLRSWKKFEADDYEIIGYLPSVYSGYGNVLNSEAERLAMLDEGFAIVHQVKSAACGLAA